jgi:hypothetical protein
VINRFLYAVITTRRGLVAGSHRGMQHRTISVSRRTSRARTDQRWRSMTFCDGISYGIVNSIGIILIAFYEKKTGDR